MSSRIIAATSGGKPVWINADQISWVAKREEDGCAAISISGAAPFALDQKAGVIVQAWATGPYHVVTETNWADDV